MLSNYEIDTYLGIFKLYSEITSFLTLQSIGSLVAQDIRISPRSMPAEATM